MFGADGSGQPWLRQMTLVVGALVLGSVVGVACIDDDRYPTVAFRCDPRSPDNCPESYFCCSDDPAAEGGALPAYEGKNIPGGATPYFSGINNALGVSGMCVQRDDVPLGGGLQDVAAFGCPVPCNPTWDPADIAAVCGAGRSCCQTVQLQEADCIRDPVEGTFRPVTGHDIRERNEAGMALTDWSPAAHATHQDPSGTACRALAGEPSDAELSTDPVYLDCISTLTVANQRGFCLDLGGDVCPVQRPDYVDACERLDGAGA